MWSVGAAIGVAVVGSAGFVVPIEEFSQFFKVLTKRFKHAALVQGGGRM